MTRFVVILPAEPTSLKVGEEFAADAWPAHITLVPGFASDAAPQEVAAKVEAALAAHRTPDVVFRAIEPFVERGSVDVNFVTVSHGLVDIHRSLLSSLKEIDDLALDTPDHHGDSYVPHAKVVASGPVPVGVTLKPNRVLLAALPTPGGNPSRRIVWEGPFTAQ